VEGGEEVDSWRCTSYLSLNMDQAQGFDVLVVVAGGNDLDNGAKRPYFDTTYDQIDQEARFYGVRKVIITSLWPRWYGRYNRSARRHEEYMEAKFRGHRRIIFWTWDERQSFCTYDWSTLAAKRTQESHHVSLGSHLLGGQETEEIRSSDSNGANTVSARSTATVSSCTATIVKRGLKH